METCICKVSYGKANFSNVLSTYGSFKISPPFVRVTALTSGKRLSNSSSSVIPVGRFEHNGVLISQAVEHTAGTVILLTSKWMRGPKVLREGALFVRLRDGAPWWDVVASVPTAADNVCGDSFSMFNGRGDILTADELKLLSIEVGRTFIGRFMNEEELNECFRLVKLGESTIPRPAISAIATPSGIEMREIAQEPLRRMVLRKKGV